MFYDDFQIYDSTDVTMATAQIKRGQNDFFEKKHFLTSDFRNGISRYYVITPPIFAMFHPQTTEIKLSAS